MIKIHKKIWVRILPFFMALVLVSGFLIHNRFYEVKAVDKFEEAKTLIEPYVEALKEQHPNWTFEYYDTGLEWATVLENEMLLKRNLVPDSPHTMMVKGVDSTWYQTPTSWKSTVIDGAFNWEKNQWVELSGGGWIQASEEAVSYIMDPRNWITEQNIFSFEQLSYNSEVHTKAVLKKMMDNTFMDCDYAWVSGSGGKTYADVLIEAGKKYNVSPVYLCSKLLYEKGGAGKYNSSTDKYTMNDTLGNGVSSTDGVNYHAAKSGETAYYNMFNIQAAGSTVTAVINNGGAEAKNAGWTSQYLAIMGGVELIAKKYIAYGQTTLYFQKFAVSVPESYRYWKQYQQAITAAVNEGWNNMDAYRSMDSLESPFSFIIPVYYDMPAEACAKPTPETSTANPNYKLSKLVVNGIDIWGNSSSLLLTPTFNMDTYNYSIVVPYTTSKVKIGAVAIADTTKITGTGTVDVAVGENTFKIVCQSEYGTKIAYRVNITRAEGSTLLTQVRDESGTIKMNFDSMTTDYEKEVANDVETIQLRFEPESDYAKVVLLNTKVVMSGDIPDTAKDVKTSDSGITYGVYTKELNTLKDKTYGYTPKLYLEKGENRITFDVYPSANDNSTKTRYTVWVYRYDKTEYSLNNIQVNNTYVGNFEVGDTVKKAISKLTIKNGKFVITDKDGNPKKDDEVICTGDVLKIMDANEHEMESYKIVIYGDVNGDGKIDIYDFAYVRKMLIKKTGLQGIYLVAADVYPESQGIDIYDFAIVRRYIIKGTAIDQKR